MSPDQKILIERVKDSNLHYRITPKLAAPQVARPYSYLGEVPVTTPAPEDRQVNVVTSEPVPNRHMIPAVPLGGGLLPGVGYGLQVLNRSPAPKFSGNSQDWGDFLRQWGKYEKMINEVNPQRTTDTLLLAEFKGCLDASSREVINFLEESQPNVSFKVVLAELNRTYGYDPIVQNRRSWENIKLNIPGAKLTKRDWIQFCAGFRVGRARVPGATDTEALSILRQQIPFEWKKRVHTEEFKQRNRRGWVRVVAPGLSFQEIRQIFTECLNDPNVEVIAEGLTSLVDCGSQEKQRFILNTLNGDVVNDVVLTITATQPDMNSEQVMEWILMKLGEDEQFSEKWDVTEEPKELPKSAPPTRDVREVKGIPPAQDLAKETWRQEVPKRSYSEPPRENRATQQSQGQWSQDRLRTSALRKGLGQRKRQFWQRISTKLWWKGQSVPGE